MRPADPRTGARPAPGRPGAPAWPAGPPPWAREDHPGWAGRRSHRSERPIGPVIAATLFHVLGERSAGTLGPVQQPADVVPYALLVLGPIALCWLCRTPVVVLAVAAAASIGFGTVSEPRWTFAVAPVIALFHTVKAGRRRAGVAVAAAGWLAYLLVTRVFAEVLGVPEQARPDLRVIVTGAVGLALTVLLASGSKARGEFRAEMAKRQAEQARTREEQERRQASEERLRIARELHDVLGHHLSLINVQAGVGLHLMDNRPEQAREALAAIKTASAEALREVRAVLGVLRPEEEAAPRQPAVGLARLAELTGDAGLTVTTTVRGRPRDLPAEVDRAAYRIVQEALTNVRRHAAAGAAGHVTVDYRDTDLLVTIGNDGPGTDGPEAAGGSGIAGMRARAASLGGSLTAAARPDGGFQVVAVLPTERREAS